MINSMRKLCPNLDKQDGLETVLEVPIPEEMFNKMNMGNNNILNNNNAAGSRWQNMHNNLMRARRGDKSSSSSSSSSTCNDQFMLLLKLIGSASIPCQAQTLRPLSWPVKNGRNMILSTATYIVQQYVAATGGLAALNSIQSMYAMGQVEMNTALLNIQNKDEDDENVFNRSNSEYGGFVVWQMNPDLWYLELVVSGCKISGGSDGKISWNQSSTSNSTVSKGSPKPLRRFFEGLDPKSTANLFLNAVCVGEKTIKGEECFILKIDADSEMLKSQSRANTEVVFHTIWGYFSQRTGLLIKFEDSKLVKMKSAKRGGGGGGGYDNVFWETTMQSVLEDYRNVEGINIAHKGKTHASIYRYGEKVSTKWRIEELWNIEEVDFNICGLSRDCFLPPADVNSKEQTQQEEPGVG